MKTIAIILPYFGDFPNYFDKFITSCKFNPTINWIIYTDNNPQISMPKNITIIQTTFNEFRNRFRDVLGDDIVLDRPYKLCDYKVTYGEVLSDDIKEFDFWGYCDCDLVFGDLRSFLTDEILENFDKLFTRGHFTLFRNHDDVNTRYKNVTLNGETVCEKIFRSETCYMFDEWGKCGISNYYLHNGIPQYDQLLMDDIIFEKRSFYTTKSSNGRRGPYHDEDMKAELYGRYKKMKNIAYFYDKGKFFRTYISCGELKHEEVMYVHFQKRKLENCEHCETFVVVPNKFIEKSDMPDYKFLKSQCKEDLLVKKFYKNALRQTERVKRYIIKRLKNNEPNKNLL